MNKFLYRLAEHLLETYGDKISNLCIVFPSRRAGLYFRKHLSSFLKKPLWSPTIYSIEEFVEENSNYILADDLVLRFELYNVFKNYGESTKGGESFDKFYAWAGMLLNDFDEIDKNLVPANDLFRVIKEIKNVEESFSLPLEELEQFKAFWRTFSGRQLSKTQEEFFRIWNLLNKIYNDFKTNLEKQNLAYEGMAVRTLVEDIESNRRNFNEFEKIIFAGFNSLSKSEENIISLLLEKNKAETYWDADEYYINDELQEAGKFLRQNFKSLDLKSPQWIENNFINSGNKLINFIGAPLNVGQAKTMGDRLDNIIKEKSFSFESTAVILPDESLLLPVLYSIPSEVKKLNVTMGFQFKYAPLYNLFELIKNLQLNKKVSKSGCVFYHKDVTAVLMHPYIKYSAPEYIYDLVNNIKRYSIIYITDKKIIGSASKSPELLSLVFNPVSASEEIFDYIYKILNVISTRSEFSDDGIDGPAEPQNPFELEYFYSVYEQLNRLKDIIAQYKESVEEKVFWQIIIECLKSIKIPFTGEPLESLQVMGLLESRALDFENIFILSMNESILPKGNTYSSFIPYNLRKAFKLPTYEDTDSISAYYFYRLLQRAKNIYLFYNTENDNIYSGEKSRFLIQLETELNKYSNIELNSFITQTTIDEAQKTGITIPKTASLIERLQSENHFSATDIINYISCSLMFYFKKLAKLEEQETVEEYFSPSTFGKIFHSMMQLLYSGYKDKFIDKAVIEILKNELVNNYNSLFEQACKSIDELKEMSPEPHGKNLLFKNVIKKLVDKVLNNELNEVPYKLIDIEAKLNYDLQFVSAGNQYKIDLLGRLDRIDEKDNVKRILDYKTGYYKPEGKSLASDELLGICFQDPKYKENFQAAFYGYLYLLNHPSQQIQLGIYSIKKLDEGISFIDNIDLSGEGFKKFEDNLKNLFSEIFDINKPFSQTKETDRCEFCPYASICYREKV